MTFQAVIILTCDFWFVFGSFLAGEQALQLWRGNRPWRERASEGGGPSHWRACSQTIFFFVTMLLYFLGLEVFFVFSRAWSVAKMKRKKRAAEREDVSIVCQRRKPFKSRNTRLHRQTSLFFRYMKCQCHPRIIKMLISFNGKSNWSRCPKVGKYSSANFWPLNKSWPFNDRGSICNANS